MMRKEYFDMTQAKRHPWVLLLVLILLAIPVAVVSAKELGSLTISGPGIEGEMTIDNAGGMMKLEQTGFFDQSRTIKPPENPGAGYDITAYLNLDGNVVPFVQMVYYAADADQPGYVHYTARLTGETLRPVDQWRQLSKDADTAFRGLMQEYKVALQPAVITVAAEAAPVVEPVVKAQPVVKEPVAEPAAPTAANPAVALAPSQVVMILAVSFFVLLGAALIMRRRTEGQRSSQV
jgi:hypothetical protein